MEEVLETYAAPYDAAFPVVCMDEQPVQGAPLEPLAMLVICFANYHFALLMALRVKRYYTGNSGRKRCNGKFDTPKTTVALWSTQRGGCHVYFNSRKFA